MAHDNQAAAKISGYLEKKGKMRMVSSWKKYWFVLEGRLLLYYRSKAEYDALGPCKGSITLGTPCNIKPALASSCIFQIETRSNTTILRAENRYEQEKWMQAILAALNQMTSSSPAKMSHFRYSADDLVPTPTADNKMQKPVFSRQNTMPERIGKGPQNKNVIERIQMLGGQTYGGSLNTINKLATKINDSPKISEGKVVEEENSLYARVDKVKDIAEQRKSVLVENTEYASVSKDGVKGSRESVLVENEEYASADLLREAEISKENRDSCDGEFPTRKREHIYQEIRGNSLQLENSEYCSIADVAEPSNLDQNDNIYNDPTTYVEPLYGEKIYEVPSVSEVKDRTESMIYQEPALPPRPKPEDETSSQSSIDQKRKKGTTLQKLARMVSDVKKDGRKRNSFVLRMFKKIRKSDIKEDDEPVVTKSAEDGDVQDDIQVLSELQKLLDNKKQMIEMQMVGKNPHNNKSIIERIRMLGGQKHGGSLNSINKLVIEITKDSPKTVDSDQGVSEENCLYVKADKFNENEEQSKTVLVENTDYASADCVLVQNDNYTSLDVLRHSGDSKEKDSVPRVSSESSYIYDDPISYAETSVPGGKDTPESVIYQEPALPPRPDAEHLSTSLDNIYDDLIPLRSEKIYEIPSVIEDNDALYEEASPPPRLKIEDETINRCSTYHKPKKLTLMQKLSNLVSEVKNNEKKRNSTKLDIQEADVTNDEQQNDIKVLIELQTLLDNKKQLIEEKIKTSSLSDDSPEDCPSGAFEDKIEYAEIDEEEKEKDIPSLPPKQRNISDYRLDFNEVTINNALNIPRPKLIQKPKKVKKCVDDVDEKLKTIDEILDDLDNEKKEIKGRQKVKELIEKFNDHCNCEEVELRKKNVVVDSDPSRHSDDLNILLEELSKVTNAPILTPGVTTSLISTPQPSEEWKNLIPIRKRRFSEPDYDIPRPHSALQIMPAVENNDNPMKPTRFFGPVLIDYNLNGDAIEGNISITPDSLEIDHVYHNRHTFNSTVEEDRSLFSYTSHNYSGDMRTLDKRLTKEEIYSRPKSLTSGHPSLSEYDHMLEKTNLDSKREEYEDSLEYSQTLTSF